MPLHRNALAQLKNGRRIGGAWNSFGGKERMCLSVPIASGFDVGRLYGRYGATVDAIKTYTGTRVSACANCNHIVISGGADGCELAKAIVVDLQEGRCTAHDITCLRTIVMDEYDGVKLVYYEGEGFDEYAVWYAGTFLSELGEKNANKKKEKEKETSSSAKMAATEATRSMAALQKENAALQKENAALRAQLAAFALDADAGWRLGASRK